MNPEYYFQKGLRLIVASAVIFALIVLFSAMVSRGFPLWLALVLLVPAGLDRILLFQRGQFGGSFGAFFSSFWV